MKIKLVIVLGLLDLVRVKNLVGEYVNLLV